MESVKEVVKHQMGVWNLKLKKNKVHKTEIDKTVDELRKTIEG